MPAKDATHDVATQALAATDLLVRGLLIWYQPNIACRHGHPTIHVDPEAEKKLRMKIDLFVIPTVSMIYLFTYIDRSNIDT